MIRLLATIAALLTALPTAGAEQRPALGTVIEDLLFKDIRYLPRSLADFPEAKAYCLVFVTTQCPVAQRYLPVLDRLERTYRDQGVVLLAVNVGPGDTIQDMALQAVEHELEMPMVKDFGGACARKLGVTRVPQAVVLDGERRLRYRGRIDDRYRLGGARPAATTAELADALDDVLAGREVRRPEAPVDGCLISFPTPEPARSDITYGEHIAPLLARHCTECHRPGTSAPFSLLTYDEVLVQAEMIGEVVAEERMPPWYASRAYGHFVNQRRLSGEEKRLVDHWLRGGRSRGPLEESPPPAPAASAWRIDPPDLIVSAPAHEIPAEGTVAYHYTILPHVFRDDTWVEQVEIRPDNPRVVHHANLAFMVLGESFNAANFITGYVPGGEAMRLTDGVAFRIPKLSLVGLQIHYVTTGKPERCQIEVGFRHCRQVVQQQLRFMRLIDRRFAIPPGAPAHRVSDERVLGDDAVGIGLFVHMHLRGRDMTFRAHRPEATQPETLLVVPNYNFDWQMPYQWPTGQMHFPRGTRIECVAHYDNSTFNPYNPDPSATVRHGQQTADEMMNGFLFYVRAGEQLGLAIDPETGRARGAADKASDTAPRR